MTATLLKCLPKSVQRRDCEFLDFWGRVAFAPLGHSSLALGGCGRDTDAEPWCHPRFHSSNVLRAEILEA